MEYGMPVLMENNTLEENAMLCRELGLSFIELNLNLPEYQPDSFCIEQALLLAQRYSFYFTIHLHEDCDPCSFDSYVATAWLDSIQAALSMASALKAPIVNLHMPQGVYFTLPDRRVFLFERYREHYLQALHRLINCCREVVKNSPMEICVENTSGFAPAYLREGVELLLAKGGFGLTYDIGHNASSGGTDTAFFLKHQCALRHFHIHDAEKTEHHLALGTGTLEIADYLKLAQKHHCRCVLETKTRDSLLQSVAWLKQHHFWKEKEWS